MYDFRSDGDTRGMAVEPIRWQTVIARVAFLGGALSEIRLYPVELGYASGKRSQRGRPLLATGEMASEILCRVQRLCAAYDTRLEIEDEVGVIRVAS